MPRLNIATSGDIDTISPVSAFLIRTTKDGPVNISNLLIGSHYNISMDGILSTSTDGELEDETFSIESSKIKLDARSINNEDASYNTIFDSITYFYPGLKIKGHLELTNSVTNPLSTSRYSGSYVITDLISQSKLVFKLKENTGPLLFELERFKGDETTPFDTVSHNLSNGQTSLEFEFRYLDNGKSALYIITYDSDNRIQYNRIWIGDLELNMNECTVGLKLTTNSSTVKRLESDYIFMRYPSVYLTYDVEAEDIYTGQIIVYDDNNSLNPQDWTRMISRDYKFKGNRVIENGIIRIVITTDNPVIELWGWNYELEEPLWEKFGEIVPLNDQLLIPSKIQNVLIENFSINQIRLSVNFGNTVYNIVMNRGNPHITILDKFSKYFKIRTTKTRFAGDFNINTWYRLNSSVLFGNPSVRNNASEDLTTIDMKDNWWSWYEPNTTNSTVGYMANLIYPQNVKVSYVNEVLEILFRYENSSNLYGIGCLIGNPRFLINSYPEPFVVSNPDKYIKYRANESLWSFRQSNFIRRRPRI